MTPGNGSAPPGRSSVIRAPGAFIAGPACGPLWRFLQRAVAERQRDGARVRPELHEALDALRLAALEHTTATGHAGRTLPDIEASSLSVVVSTSTLADLLLVGERQARRLAAAEGITPLARGVWRREDATALAATRPR